jgi:hypothetical protein
MRDRRRALFSVLAAALLLGAAPASAPIDLPLVDGKEALATVNGEPVTRAEFEYQIVMFHASMEDPGKAGHAPDAGAVLRRLIEVKLIVQEARNIGLDEAPAVRNAVQVFENAQLKNFLLERQVAGITRPDPERVEKLYRSVVTRYRVSSAAFEKEEDAKSFDAAIRGGGTFDSLAKDAVAAGRASLPDDGAWLGAGEMGEAFLKQVASLKPGEVGAPIRIGSKFVLIQLLETKVIDDSGARNKAAEEALKAQKVERLQKFTETLKARYAKVDKKVLDSIDYDAPQPGFAAYLEDTRAVARIRGGDPVTVAALTDAIQRKFFHEPGASGARKELNRRKAELLGDLLSRRLTVIEAKRLGIDRSEPFRDSIRGYREEVIFGAFMQKVIDPAIKVEDDALRRFYEAHRAEFVTPEMVTAQSLAFAQRTNAEAALGRLRQGADFDWTRANAEGQLDPKEDTSLLSFPAALVVAQEMPEGLQKALTGAEAGDYRLYEAPAGPSYVVRLVRRVPSDVRPFEEVKGALMEPVLAEERKRAVEEWAAKLKKAYEVKEFVNDEQLRRLVLEGTGPAK